jgi:3-oxoacyl-[acyl-carrier-protein] synthase III
MRWSDVHVTASAMVLGKPEDTATAVSQGRYYPAFHAAHGYLSVSVADDDRPAMEFAVDAARLALSRSRMDPADIGLTIHASVDRQGPDDIPPASYIHGKAVGGRASALEVKQACNGGIAALEMGAAYLTAMTAASSVLITTSDRCEPGADRYQSGLGELAGDGATALILSRVAGVARVLSTVILGDGSFLKLPGAAPPAPGTGSSRQELIAEQRRRLQPMLRAMSALQRQCVEAALADAGTDGADISRWVFANVGLFLVDRKFRDAFGVDDSKTTWEWGRTVGHLNAGNQIAGLTYLIESGAVRPGDRIALFGNAVGFSYGCAVIEITANPDWAAAGS